jgi:hypothetical protein
VICEWKLLNRRLERNRCRKKEGNEGKEEETKNTGKSKKVK